MFGKFFASTFTGSMVGSGLNVFAVWGYVIANTRQDGTVEINPPIVAAVLGCAVGEVTAALDVLTSPDPDSRSKKEEGRRLIQQAAFLYSVPTYADYRAIRDDDGRKEYMRQYMQGYRDKKKAVNVNVNSGKTRLAHADTEAEVDTEAKKELAAKPQPRKRGKPAKVPIPDDFALSARVEQWAKGKGFDRLTEHLEYFRGKAKANGYAYADWDEAFMGAVRDDWAKLRLAPSSNGSGRKRVDL